MPDESKPDDDDIEAATDDAESPAAEPASADKTDDAESSDEHTGSSRSGGVLAVIAMLVAIATLGASAYMWRNPQTPPEPKAPTYSDTERNDAKAKVCGAYNLISSGVASTSSLQAPGGPEDVVGALAVAANAKLALYGGGQYLLASVVPATPADLADAARTFANTLIEVGIAAIAQAPPDDPAQGQRLQDAESQSTHLQTLCE